MAKTANSYIVIYGNPCDGYSFFGPFATEVDAVEYAESLGDYESWHIGTLTKPEE